MVFYNIFKNENKSEENKTKKQAQKIIIDNREKNSLVIANLIEQKAEIQFENLQIGDYIIGDTAIERKTCLDFISSMADKRIFYQLWDLKKFQKSFLILEGSIEQIESEHMKKASKSFILSIITKYRIPIIFTKDEKETAETILIIANKSESNRQFSLRPSRTFLSKEERKQFILEGFPQIGPITSQKLLGKLKTIKNIINAPEQELKEILGKKYENFKELIE